MGEQWLEKAIFDTVRYFDLFQMPLTATQLWRCLIIDGTGKSAVRWGGHAQVSLRQIQRVLHTSAWLASRLDTRWGYYFLLGKEYLVRERLTRHGLAQMKWKILRRVAPSLAAVPFVRSLAGSGSLAIDNTKPNSDLDLFVIVRQDRIWTARLLLLLVSQLLGKRRKYWNVQAPDKVCLNHYVADAALEMPPAVINLYTAVQYTLHVPVSGAGVLQAFQKANAPWMHRYVMAPELPHVHHLYTVRLPGWMRGLKMFLERWLMEPLGDIFETVAAGWQQQIITGHQAVGRLGRVQVSDQELAFHPDTKVPALLARFYQEQGQRQLL